MKEKRKEERELKNIRDILIETKKEYGEKTACNIYNKKHITYNHLYGDISALGSYMYEILNIHKDVVGILSENSYNSDIAIYSCIFGDNIVCNIDQEIDSKQLEELMKHTNMKILFFSNKMKDKIEEIRIRNRKVKFISLEDKDTNCISIKYAINEGISILRSGINDYMNIKIKGEDKKVCIVSNNKVRYIKAENIINYINCIKDRLDIKSKDICISTLHLSDTVELLITRLLNMYNGATLIHTRNKNKVLEYVKENNCSVIVLSKKELKSIAKTLNKYIEKNKDTEKINRLIFATNKMGSIGIKMKKIIFRDILSQFSNTIEKIIVFGDNLDKENIELLSNLGLIVITGYTTKNNLPLVTLSNVNDIQIDNSGKPLDFMNVSIRLENRDGIGEIYIKNIEEREYINTEDTGYIDNKGNLCVIGKKENEILLECGEKIYPEYIEDKLRKIHNVEEAFVYLRKINGKKQLFANLKLKEKYCIVNNEINSIMIYDNKFAKKMSKKERKNNKNKTSSLEKMIKRDNRKFIKNEINTMNLGLSRYNKIVDFEIVENI